ASPAATAAALPPDEPPGTRSRSQGLDVGPKAEFSVDEPIANSSRLRRPQQRAPAPFSLSVAVASYGETNFASIRLDAVSGCPATEITSLIPTGIPSSGRTAARPSPFACARRSSEALAWALAPGSAYELKGRTPP